MRIGKNWLDQLYDRSLRKQLKLQSRQQAPVGYQQATSIGILTDTQDLETLETVKKFVHAQKKRQVKVLAYFNDKEAHPNFPFAYFGNRDVNLISKPKGSEVEQFMAQPFDILFNLCLEENLMLGYIAALSNAKMRIGPYQEKTDYYDLMIDIPKGKGIKYFIEQAEQILANINSEHEVSTI